MTPLRLRAALDTHNAMSLNAGTKLGAYVIVALIGAGGMGELCTDAALTIARSADCRILKCH
jgi:hypothetical protein